MIFFGKKLGDTVCLWLFILAASLLLVACGGPGPSPPGPALTKSPEPTPTFPVTVPPEPTIEETPGESRAEPPVAPRYTYDIIRVYPHDAGAFTQGLVFTDGVFYEGTGLYGLSSLREVEPESGKVLRIYELPDWYFGEGIAVLDDRVYQLTWRENTCFVYNRRDFLPVTSFYYPTEGWGLTDDGRSLIMSDGTSTIFFKDPGTFEVIRSIKVHDGDTAVTRINELEYVRGEILANIWQTDSIARISPADGEVTGWIDLSGILESSGYRQGTDVLNGIAYDASRDRLFVTGKLWPAMFEIKLVPVSP